ADKTILDSYGESAILKRGREDDDDQEGPSAGSDRMSASESAFAEESVQTTCQMDEPSHSVFETDFSNFIMNRLGVDTLTPELLAGPTYELMMGSCNSLTELKYHLEEVYKAMTDQLDWVNPEGQQYPHNLLQPLPLIPDNRGHRVIPFEHFINNDIEYLLGGASSRKYKTSMTKTKAADYGYIKWIEDLVPRKLSNLTVEERFAFNVSLRMFTRSIVIQRRVEDLQMGVESYQKRLNLTKPDTYRSDLKRMQYLPTTIWRKGDKDRAAAMIQAIDKMLKTRRIMRSLERFVGRRQYEGDFQMRQKTI
nr:hypothetical protein [Tanacetum cinerariifolium]